MISPNVSRKIMTKTASVTALFQAGLDAVVVGATKFHGNRLLSSVDKADAAEEKAADRADVLQALANQAAADAITAEEKATAIAIAVDEELTHLGL
jgi:hypothetical protein